MNEPYSHWTLRKEFRFEASHQLMHHDGKCRRLHGHSFILTVECSGRALQPETAVVLVSSEIGDRPRSEEQPNPKHAMLIDYGEIKLRVQPIVDNYLDHWHLNDTFGTDSPTSEFLAQRLFYMILGVLPELTAIEIAETCTSACRFELK